MTNLVVSASCRWDNFCSASSDPLRDLTEVLNAAGAVPTSVEMSSQVFRVLWMHPATRDRLRYLNGITTHLTPEQEVDDMLCLPRGTVRHELPSRLGAHVLVKRDGLILAAIENAVDSWPGQSSGAPMPLLKTPERSIGWDVVLGIADRDPARRRDPGKWLADSAPVYTVPIAPRAPECVGPGDHSRCVESGFCVPSYSGDRWSK